MVKRDANTDYDIHESLAESAWDMFNDPAIQHQIAENHEWNMGLIERTGATVGAFASIAGKVLGVKIVITIRFNDLTSARFEVVGLEGSYTCSSECIGLEFKVVTRTSMIGTQSRRPCRAVQLGEAVLLKKPVSPMPFAPRISHLLLKL
ncbi:hypothetical protein CXF95_02305 [Paraglaciecola sp. MB-3u-78]|nr:hypothetical protein CXF95_02305 [Paraglaciecola sp. MB-3u-78]